MSIQNICEKLGYRDTEIIPIVHEEAMVAQVYRVQGLGQEPVILKLCTSANLQREVYFLRHFEEIILVPKVLKVFDGGIVLEYLKGHLLDPLEITKTLANDLGRTLAKIHQNRTSGYGDLIQSQLFQDPWTYLSYKFDEGIEECRQHLPSSLITKCKKFFESQYLYLQNADGPCIVHRDFRPGNIIADDGEIQGVIDWAGCRASFAEEDLCSLEHGEWTLSPNLKEEFLNGYGTIRPVPDFYPLIPFLRLNKAIATIGFTVKRGTWDNYHSKIYKLNRQFLDQLL